MKTCTACGESKPLTEFDHRPDRPGAFRSRCKACQRTYNKQFQPRNPRRNIDSPKACRRCKVVKPVDDFATDRAQRDGKTTRCNDCLRELAKEKREANPDESRMWVRIRRARRLGNGFKKYRNRDIFERDNFTCVLCGRPTLQPPPSARAPKPTPPLWPTIDHRLPYAQGGPDEPDNVNCAHNACNLKRRDADFEETRRAFTANPPRAVRDFGSAASI